MPSPWREPREGDRKRGNLTVVGSENATSWCGAASAVVEVLVGDADSDSAAASLMPLAWTWVHDESLDIGLWFKRGMGEEWEGNEGRELASRVWRRGGIEG